MSIFYPNNGFLDFLSGSGSGSGGSFGFYIGQYPNDAAAASAHPNAGENSVYYNTTDFKYRIKLADGTWANIESQSGPQGTDGLRGWSPILSLISRGDDVVMRVGDWTGGQGPKPTTGYLGQAGLVATIEEAVNIRGLQGLAKKGDKGDIGISITNIAIDNGTPITDGTRYIITINLSDNTQTRLDFIAIKGEDGSGVPSGGTTGQVLTKESDVDGAVGWEDAQGGVTSGKTYLPAAYSSEQLTTGVRVTDSIYNNEEATSLSFPIGSDDILRKIQIGSQLGSTNDPTTIQEAISKGLFSPVLGFDIASGGDNLPTENFTFTRPNAQSKIFSGFNLATNIAYAELNLDGGEVGGNSPSLQLSYHFDFITGNYAGFIPEFIVAEVVLQGTVTASVTLLRGTYDLHRGYAHYQAIVPDFDNYKNTILSQGLLSISMGVTLTKNSIDTIYLKRGEVANGEDETIFRVDFSISQVDITRTNPDLNAIINRNELLPLVPKMSGGRGLLLYGQGGDGVFIPKPVYNLSGAVGSAIVNSVSDKVSVSTGLPTNLTPHIGDIVDWQGNSLQRGYLRLRSVVQNINPQRNLETEALYFEWADGVRDGEALTVADYGSLNLIQATKLLFFTPERRDFGVSIEKKTVNNNEGIYAIPNDGSPEYLLYSIGSTNTSLTKSIKALPQVFNESTKKLGIIAQPPTSENTYPNTTETIKNPLHNYYRLLFPSLTLTHRGADGRPMSGADNLAFLPFQSDTHFNIDSLQRLDFSFFLDRLDGTPVQIENREYNFSLNELVIRKASIPIGLIETQTELFPLSKIYTLTPADRTAGLDLYNLFFRNSYGFVLNDLGTGSQIVSQGFGVNSYYGADTTSGNARFGLNFLFIRLDNNLTGIALYGGIFEGAGITVPLPHVYMNIKAIPKQVGGLS